MATITLRPTSASGDSWSNIANAYDGSTSTSATVTTTSSNYSSRAGTFNFDTSVIPSGATINSATLYVNCKSSNNSRTKLYADINGSSSSRVINVTIGTSQTNRTADVASYMSSLNTIKLMQYNSRTSSYTFTLYDIWIEVDYTVSTTYTVRFLDWDNSVISTQTVTSGGSATPPPNPTRNGYTFSGWQGSYTNVTANVDIIAQYTQNSSSGGGGGSISGKVFDIYMKDINIGDTTVTDNTTGVTLDILGTDWTKNGDGIVFGANSAIRYNNGLFDSIGEACTIMLEVEVPDSSSASDLEYLFYWGDDYWLNDYGLYMCALSRGIELTENSSYEFIRLSTDSFSTRDMYFITYDSTDATIKKQTTTLGTKSLPMSTLPTPATVVFGNQTSLGYAMNGTMYRIAVFDKVLNDDEIADFVSGVSGTKNIKIGSSTIDKLYLGTSRILKVYLGNILL